MALRIRCWLLLLVVLFALRTTPAAARADGEVRLLVVMGGGTWENSVFQLFDSLDGVDATVVMSDQEAFETDIRNRYDALLMYNLSGSLAEPARTHLTRFLESGKGLVVLHHALASYGDWEWWHKEVVGGRYFLRPEGPHAASTYRQDESIVARPEKEHPVVASLGGHPMHLYDETYKGLWISPEVEVLLSTALSTSDGPLVWVGPYHEARVVAIQPGHGSGAFYNLGFRSILRDAVHWVGAGQP